MKIDYTKLVSDLKKAHGIAKIEAEKSDDGGSANLDSLVLRIPKARESKVIESIKAAGLYCSGKSEWFGSCYFIRHSCGGQGNRNTKAVQAMDKSLSANGWETNIFYKMD